MKRLLGILAVAGLVLASCQLAVTNSGTLKIVLPGSPSRATLDNSTAVRLQLTRNGAIVPIQGDSFIEKPLSGQTVSISGLAPGSGYVVQVSTGHRAGGETFYRTDLYAASDAFEISAGVDTAVSVTLDNTRVQVVEAAEAAHAIVVTDNGSLYYLNGADLYVAGSPDSSSLSNYAQFQTGVVQGLGHDGNTLWLNTSKGVSVLSGTFPAPSMLDSNDAPISPSVTDSGRIDLGSPFSYYIGQGLTAGVEVGAAETTWTTMDDLLSFSPDLKKKLQGQIFRGVASTGTFAVVATSIGAFRLVEEMLTDADALGTDLTNGTHNGQSIEIGASDSSLLIGPVSGYSNGINGTSGSGLIFGGTNKGLYASATDGDGKPSTASGLLELVPGTLGMNITQLATNNGPWTLIGSTSGIYTVAYSANTRELLVLKDFQLVDRISAFEGLPSGDVRLALYKVGVDVFAVVSGGDATVRVKLGRIQVS